MKWIDFTDTVPNIELSFWLTLVHIAGDLLLVHRLSSWGACTTDQLHSVLKKVQSRKSSHCERCISYIGVKYLKAIQIHKNCNSYNYDSLLCFDSNDLLQKRKDRDYFIHDPSRLLHDSCEHLLLDPAETRNAHDKEAQLWVLEACSQTCRSSGSDTDIDVGQQHLFMALVVVLALQRERK